MKFREYFKDPRKGILKEEFDFGGERYAEFLKALKEQPRSGKVLSSQEMMKLVLRKRARFQRLRQRKQEREAQVSQNNPDKAAS